MVRVMRYLTTYLEAVGLYASSPANDAPTSAPAIEDFTFRGMGCCVNSEGGFWSYNSILGTQAESIADCAAACEEE